MRKRGWFAGLCVFGAACGGDSGTGPQVQNVAGSYNYSVPNLGTVGANCQVQATMTVTQQGAAFSGSYAGAAICTSSAGTDTIQAAGTVVNGRVKGDSVYFDFDDTNWHDMGTIVGSDWQGIVNARLPASGTPTVLAGNFTSTKQ